MRASEIDKIFDEDKKEALDYFNTSKIKMLNEETKRVNIDFPVWIINAIDKEAKHIGVNRQAIVKMWLTEKLNSMKKYNNNISL